MSIITSIIAIKTSTKEKVNLYFEDIDFRGVFIKDL